MSAHSRALASRASRKASTAGTSRCFTPRAAATFMAVGDESLDDCDVLTWSLGWTGLWLPRGWPASWGQRVAVTSLTVLLYWVSLPVIPTCSGDLARCAPAR